MKSYIKVIAVLLFLIGYIFLSVKFDIRDEYDMERESRQEQLEERFDEGIAYAQDSIANHLDTVLMDFDFEIEDIYGISPEEALRIMENYLDDEPISEDELANAIWAISAYYFMVQDVPNDVEDYWIY